MRNEGTMDHWSAPFYRLVDANSPELLGWFSPDIRCQVGNHPPTLGLAELGNGPLGAHSAAVTHSKHIFHRVWDPDPATAILEATCTYYRRDGVEINVPVVTILHRDGGGLIDDIKLYIDTSPLFAQPAIR